MVLTRGYLISAAKKIRVNIGHKTIFPTVLEMRLSIVSGSSGGGIFDQQGKLVGIAEAGTMPSYAVPVEKVRAFLRRSIGFEAKD